MPEINAREIREVVARDFNAVGEFQTTDVVGLFKNDETDSSNIAAALYSWEKHGFITGGFRIKSRKNHPGRAGKRLWTLVPASEVSQEVRRHESAEQNGSEPVTVSTNKAGVVVAGGATHQATVPKPRTAETTRRRFTGSIKALRDSGEMLVESDGQLYKVIPLDW